MKKIKQSPYANAFILAITSTLVLSACAGTDTGSGSTSVTPTASSTKEAGIFTKDINVCFENKTPSPVGLKWEAGVSTHSAISSLAVGETACGEGEGPFVLVTFADTFTTRVTTANNPLLEPVLYFRAPRISVGEAYTGQLGDSYANASYSQGETVGSDVEGHHFAVTRNADDDWIQFTVVIND